MKKKVNVLLMLGLVFSILAMIFSINYFVERLTNLSTLLGSPLYEKLASEKFVNASIMFFSLICVVSFLTTSLILLNKPELKVFLSRLSSPEKRTQRKEEQRQKKLAKAKETIEKYSDKDKGQQ